MRRTALILSIGLVTAIAVSLVATGLTELLRPEPASTNGIGAVSSGIAEFLVQIVAFSCAAVVLNFAMAKRIRQWGRSAVRLRRAHLSATLLPVLLPFVVHPEIVWPSNPTWSTVPFYWVIAGLIQMLFGGVVMFQLLRAPTAEEADL